MNLSNEDAAHAAQHFARRAAARWSDELGAGILGVYLIGSLAHGGFSARYSDIDVAVVAADPLSQPDLDLLRKVAADVSAELVQKLSIFWSDRGFAVGRFPPLDRVDYLDHAAIIVERERVRPARPSLEDIRTYLRGQPFASWIEQARRFAAASELADASHKPYVRCLLYPARLLVSWSTGTMASNDDAVDFLRRERVADLDLDLIERALACRRAGADLDVLFPERTKLARQVAACARAIGLEVP